MHGQCTLCTNELLFEFVEYVKICRLSEVANEVQRPSLHRRFDRMAECLKRLEFTLVERGHKGEVILTETTVLDFAIDVSFDKKELGELRASGVAGFLPSMLRDWQRPSGTKLKKLIKTKQFEFLCFFRYWILTPLTRERKASTTHSKSGN